VSTTVGDWKSRYEEFWGVGPIPLWVLVRFDLKEPSNVPHMLSC